MLIVAYHFPPEASIGTYRTLRLVRRLVADGWEVTVLTGTPGTYPANCPLDAELLPLVPAGVRVVRAPALRPLDRLFSLAKRKSRPRQAVEQAAAPPGSVPQQADNPERLRPGRQRLEALLRIPDANVGWLLPAIFAGLGHSLRRWPDVLYATAPTWTGQLVGRALAAFLGCAWVADFRDPWARAPWRESWLPAARRTAEILERSVVRRADAVVFTTRTNHDEYAAFYGPSIASKFHVVRNGCDRTEFDGVTPLPSDGRFTLLHAGSLYGGRKPTALFGALAALRDRGAINPGSFCFRQIGRVALNGFDMIAERDRLDLQGLVEVLPSQPRREILRELVSASCLLLLQPGTTVSIPGKLFEYMAAQRPILAIAEDGETAALVRATAGGVAVLPDDQRGIERVLEQMLADGDSTSTGTPVELFDGQLRTQELAAVIESMLGHSSGRQTYRIAAETTEVGR